MKLFFTIIVLALFFINPVQAQLKINSGGNVGNQFVYIACED